jgi:hypothetical protein
MHIHRGFMYDHICWGMPVAHEEVLEGWKLSYASKPFLKWAEGLVQWQHETFGPNRPVTGVLEHMRREIAEIEAKPQDRAEWADLLILLIAGADRAGVPLKDVLEAAVLKTHVNKRRKWPDWRTQPEDAPIHHLKEQPR